MIRQKRIKSQEVQSTSLC